MKITLKLIAIFVFLTVAVTNVPLQELQLSNTNTDSKISQTAVGAEAQVSNPSPWMEEISNNASFSATVSVPPVIRVANADYGLDNQGLTPSDCSTIQTQLINYANRTMQSYSTGISISVPSGASAPSLTASTQGAGSITVLADNTSGNPYTWHISGGTAVAGNYISYTFIYTLNGRQYTQKAASYVDFVELAAGWQTYVVRRNWANTSWTRHEYTATLSGSGSSGPGYAVYGGGGTGYYKMATGSGSTGFVSGASGYSGMKLWDPGYDGRDNDLHWYCGQDGPGSNDVGDGGYRATLNVYYDPSIVTNVSQLGIKLLYWRNTSPSNIPTMYQEKMIYLLGNSLFSDTSSSNASAQSYFYSTNALSNRTQNISTNPGAMTFGFAGTALPPDSQQVTFASGIFGNSAIDTTSWNAWLITFHVMNKSALRSLIAAEDTAFRQLHDGYSDADGSFTAYLNQFAKSKAVLNQPNASPAQITAAVNDLNTAKINFKYVQADYTALNALVGNVYNASLGYRPSPINDPDYYFGVNYYPSDFYQSTTDLQSALSSAVYGLDIRYQSYVNTAAAEMNIVSRGIELLDADYTAVNDYLDKIEGTNDSTGSPAGNYILANGSTYPQYEGQMLYWPNFTPASYSDWENAVYGVTLGLKIPDQTTVTAMGTALQAAYDVMAINPADYSELNSIRANALAAVNSMVAVQNPEGSGYDITYYSEASVNAIQAELNSIVDGLLMPEQASVILWTDELQALLDAKTVNYADYLYANAQKTIAAACEANAAAFYTQSSWLALVNARAAVAPGKLANEQESVNTWALDIYNARNALILNPADYSVVHSAVAAAGALNPSIYQNWSAVQSALDAVVYGLNITSQAAVDGYAAGINSVVASLVETEVSFAVNPGSTAFVDSVHGYIYGLPADGTISDLAAQGFVNITGSGHFVYTPTASGFGTGTKAEFVRDADSKIIATYYIIIFGDADGDGFADGRDACIVSMLAAGMLSQNDVGDAVYFAADANHDGLIDSLDALLLEQAGLFFAEVSQNPA